MGLYRDNGKENGNYYTIIGYTMGLYRDNGKENGNYGLALEYCSRRSCPQLRAAL